MQPFVFQKVVRKKLNRLVLHDMLRKMLRLYLKWHMLEHKCPFCPKKLIKDTIFINFLSLHSFRVQKFVSNLNYLLIPR